MSGYWFRWFVFTWFFQLLLFQAAIAHGEDFISYKIDMCRVPSEVRKFVNNSPYSQPPVDQRVVGQVYATASLTTFLVNRHVIGRDGNYNPVRSLSDFHPWIPPTLILFLIINWLVIIYPANKYLNSSFVVGFSGGLRKRLKFKIQVSSRKILFELLHYWVWSSDARFLFKEEFRLRRSSPPINNRL